MRGEGTVYDRLSHSQAPVFVTIAIDNKTPLEEGDRSFLVEAVTEGSLRRETPTSTSNSIANILLEETCNAAVLEEHATNLVSSL